MALTFAKKAAGASTPSANTNPAKSAAAPKSSNSSFLFSGAKAKEAQKTEEALQEARKAEYGLMWRFYMADGDKRKITFLDGELDADGIINAQAWYEHPITVNGKPHRYICTEASEPCPLCAANLEKVFLRGLTVIDHTPYISKSGANAGKETKNQRKLFVMKQSSWNKLSAKATKYGGLAGCSFDVSRNGEKTPNVGDDFDFIVKYESPEQIAEKFSLDKEGVSPANYVEELVYRTAEELVALGLGKATAGPGYESSKFGAKTYTSANKDLEGQM